MVLGALILGLLGVAMATDLPRVARGSFWGDGATYHSMAWSLAADLDLRYEERDLARVRETHPGGPQGLFLKKGSGGLTVDGAQGFPWVRRVREEEGRLYYAKAFAYPLAAAPAVLVFGTRGLLVTNATVLGLVLWFGYGAVRRRGFAPPAALATVLILFLGTVVPVYLLWPAPEVFGLGLVALGLCAWAAERPILSAVLFGVAGYVKPPNLLMAAPLGFAPLLTGWTSGGRAGLARGFVESLRRGAVMGVTALALYGVNAAVTGEANYQGGARKTFYDRFPFDGQGTTFDTGGFWMTTDHLGPLVAGRDDEKVSSRTGPARNPVEMPESFAWNLFYFWVGRFGGVLAYFFPALVALLLFLVLGPRERAGWLALAGVVLSWLAYIWVIPDNWYGGGGTVGNRYFLNLLPAFLWIAPRGRTRWLAGAGLVGALVFLAPILASPVRHSRSPGEHATRGPFRLLPAELTMLNDLSVFTERWRKKQPYGFVGNPERHADPDAYNLYFMDDGTHGKESYGGRSGFWLRAGEPAEVVVRAFDLAPVREIVVAVTGGPMGDSVSVRHGWSSHRLSVRPGEVREARLPVGRGLRYYDTYLHVLHLRSRRGAPLPDGRAVGAFVQIHLEMGPPFGTVPGS
jgi:hypothetical protein